jgi:hypothetical protein
MPVLIWQTQMENTLQGTLLTTSRHHHPWKQTHHHHCHLLLFQYHSEAQIIYTFVRILRYDAPILNVRVAFWSRIALQSKGLRQGWLLNHCSATPLVSQQTLPFSIASGCHEAQPWCWYLFGGRYAMNVGCGTLLGRCVQQMWLHRLPHLFLFFSFSPTHRLCQQLMVGLDVSLEPWEDGALQQTYPLHPFLLLHSSHYKTSWRHGGEAAVV